MALPNNADLHQFLAELQAAEGPDFVADVPALEAELNQQISEQTDLGVKILTILGGLLASGFLAGFLFLLQIFESPMALTIAGGLFVVGGLFIARLAKSILVETACVCGFIIGLILFTFGCSRLLHIDENVMFFLVLIGLATVLFSDKSVFIFLGVVLISGSLAGLIYAHKQYLLLLLLLAALAVSFTWLSLNEATFISRNRRFNLAFGPVRMALLVSLLVLLLVVANPNWVQFYLPYPWVGTLILLGCLLAVMFKISHLFLNGTGSSKLILLAGLGLIFLPTIYMPSIAGAMLVLIISFYIGHKAGFALAALALIYFVILFYYDLQLTLLTKSIILMVNGGLFLAGYWVIQKKLQPNEI